MIDIVYLSLSILGTISISLIIYAITIQAGKISVNTQMILSQCIAELILGKSSRSDRPRSNTLSQLCHGLVFPL